jgi:hypothetical protein
MNVVRLSDDSGIVGDGPVDFMYFGVLAFSFIAGLHLALPAAWNVARTGRDGGGSSVGHPEPERPTFARCDRGASAGKPERSERSMS